MSACIEEHFKKHEKDFKVIRLMVNGNLAYFEWE
jgi:hypothetical protein